jgi:hypothetical protein
MLRNSLLATCVLFTLILIGCSKTETGNSNTAAGNSNKATTSTASPAMTAAAGEKIGVPECDDFIAKYEACVSGKVPEIARAQYQSMLKTWRESWKKAASTPQGKAGLAAACKQAREQQETALKSFGCTW